ncbi:hypothetical protein Bca4012_089951 [Brassica carinata]
MCKFSLYMETKIPISLNIFYIEDFLGSLLREDFLGSLLRENFFESLLREDFLGSLLLDPKFKYTRRLLENFWKTSL